MKDLERAKANSLGFLIVDTGRLLRKRFDQRARAVGMTRAQWQVLAYLAMNEGSNQATLADALEIEPITLTRHLEKLEEAGLVIRQPDPSDKRARILFLAEKAGPVIEEFRAIGRALVEEVTAGLSAEEIETMKHGLQHIKKALCAPDADAAGGQADTKLPKRNVR